MTPKALSREITTQEAVARLIKALNEESDYRYSWQANIAVAMQDAYHYSKDKSNIHAISNEGAINFLNLLTKDWIIYLTTMTNDLKNFLEHERWRFLYGHIFIDNQSITDTKENALKDHDTRLINFVLE